MVGQTIGSGGLEETPRGLESGSAPRPGMVTQLGRSIGEAQVAMVNGEFESPEMSLLRCPVNDCLNLEQTPRRYPQE